MQELVFIESKKQLKLLSFREKLSKRKCEEFISIFQKENEKNIQKDPKDFIIILDYIFKQIKDIYDENLLPENQKKEQLEWLFFVLEKVKFAMKSENINWKDAQLLTFIEYKDFLYLLIQVACSIEKEDIEKFDSLGKEQKEFVSICLKISELIFEIIAIILKKIKEQMDEDDKKTQVIWKILYINNKPIGRKYIKNEGFLAQVFNKYEFLTKDFCKDEKHYQTNHRILKAIQGTFANDLKNIIYQLRSKIVEDYTQNSDASNFDVSFHASIRKILQDDLTGACALEVGLPIQVMNTSAEWDSSQEIFYNDTGLNETNILEAMQIITECKEIYFQHQKQDQVQEPLLYEALRNKILKYINNPFVIQYVWGYAGGNCIKILIDLLLSYENKNNLMSNDTLNWHLTHTQSEREKIIDRGKMGIKIWEISKKLEENIEKGADRRRTWFEHNRKEKVELFKRISSCIEDNILFIMVDEKLLKLTYGLLQVAASIRRNPLSFFCCGKTPHSKKELDAMLLQEKIHFELNSTEVGMYKKLVWNLYKTEEKSDFNEKIENFITNQGINISDIEHNLVF